MFNIFKYKIPDLWFGHWVDKNGKQLIIETLHKDSYYVSILDQNGQPYKIDLLDNKITQTIKLKAIVDKDTNNNYILQVEAGTEDIGPTYNLYFLTIDKDGNKRLANSNDDLKNIFITPNVGLGLYDDFEDNLGVPWAFPLEDFKKRI